MLEGFYKVRFQVDDAVGRSVMYANGGSMLGGNSAFAHYGTYTSANGRWKGENQEHTPARSEHPIFKADAFPLRQNRRCTYTFCTS